MVDLKVSFLTFIFQKEMVFFFVENGKRRKLRGLSLVIMWRPDPFKSPKSTRSVFVKMSRRTECTMYF